MAVVYNRQSQTNRSSVDVYHDDGSAQHLETENSIYLTEEIPVDEADLAVMFDLMKSNEEGLVSGWASVAINKDGSIPLDWQDDVIEPETLEKAAISFMQEYRESGEMHKGDSKGVVVESMVFTKDKQQAIGIPDGAVPEGWFITVKINDPDVFKKVKDGTYKMFSIQGRAKRVKL